MTKLALIAAVDANTRYIGYQNKLPWSVPEDLDHFKRITMGRAIIMGPKTYESLGSKTLPGRCNIIHEPGSDPKVALEFAKAYPIDSKYNKVYTDYIFCIGGAKTYETYLPFADKVLITEIIVPQCKGDTRFPPIGKRNWDEFAGIWQVSEKSGLSYRFIQYNKKIKKEFTNIKLCDIIGSLLR